jgi:fibronectin-binding autotransporter adhesin
MTLSDVIGDASYVAQTNWSTTNGSTGTLNKTGEGTLVLAADNTYGWQFEGLYRTTTVSAGVLQLGAGGTTGSILTHVSLAAGTTLVYDRSNTVTADKTISGAGGLIQQGDGTLILTGTKTYTGATTVADGVLRVDTAVAGSTFTVEDGAVLMGKGGTGALIVRAGGTLAAELLGPAAGQYDRINVTGTVDLTGPRSISGCWGATRRRPERRSR